MITANKIKLNFGCLATKHHPVFFKILGYLQTLVPKRVNGNLTDCYTVLTRNALRKFVTENNSRMLTAILNTSNVKMHSNRYSRRPASSRDRSHKPVESDVRSISVATVLNEDTVLIYHNVKDEHLNFFNGDKTKSASPGFEPV